MVVGRTATRLVDTQFEREQIMATSTRRVVANSPSDTHEKRR
jgi:hypothetical protein